MCQTADAGRMGIEHGEVALNTSNRDLDPLDTSYAGLTWFGDAKCSAVVYLQVI